MATTAFRVEGEKLREARLSSGMTQGQLARAINTSERNIARWEGSRNQPRIESIAAIAEATGRPVDFFLASGVDNGEKLLSAVQERVDAAEARRAAS